MNFEGLLLEHYRLTRLIERGGNGEVYLAQDQRIARQVAVKIIQIEAPESEEAQTIRRLFQREVQAIALLSHPHILPLYDVGEQMVEKRLLTYLVMPYCPDGSLETWLSQRPNKRVAPLEVVPLLQQAAGALEYAHEHAIVHRDVKPSNFLVRLRKEQLDLLLTDFGIARLENATAQISKNIRGTPAFMAPEQWRGSFMPATDQYALAIMAYKLLTGRVPFTGTQNQIMFQHFSLPPIPPSSHNAQLSPAIDEVLLRALAKQYDARYPSIIAFATAFQQAVMESEAKLSPASPAASNDLKIVVLPPDAQLYLTQPVPPAPSSPIASDIFTPSKTPDIERVVMQSLPENTGTLTPHPNWRKLLVIGAIISLFFTSIGGLLLLGNALVANNTALAVHATMTSAAATQQASVSTTPTAQITPSVLASPDATAIANPYELTQNTLVQNDTLKGNSSARWDQIKHSCTFTSAGYDITTSDQSLAAVFCFARSTQFKDMTFEVQLSVQKGSGGGVLLHGTRTGSYYFRISDEGTYALYFCNNAGTGCTRSLANGYSSSIKTGVQQNNVLAVVARAGSFDLYINGVRIDEVDDRTSLDGMIGLAAEPLSEVLCTNARVWIS